MILIRPASRRDAEIVGAALRPDDEREVQTSTGQPGTAVVPLAFDTSREVFTVWRVKDGLPRYPIALFGVADHDGLTGIVWFLGTDHIRGCALSLIRESQHWLDHMSRHYPQGLHNIADRRNALHLRWCKLTGFNLLHSVKINGFPYTYIHRPCVNQ